MNNRLNDVRFHKERDMQRAEAMKMLVQPEQEPVAIRLSNGVIDCLGTAIVPIGALLYATPPQRTWVGLTDEEIVQCQQGDIYHFYRCLEAKLKEKNA